MSIKRRTLTIRENILSDYFSVDRQSSSCPSLVMLFNFPRPFTRLPEFHQFFYLSTWSLSLTSWKNYTWPITDSSTKSQPKTHTLYLWFPFLHKLYLVCTYLSSGPLLLLFSFEITVIVHLKRFVFLTDNLMNLTSIFSFGYWVQSSL